MKTIAHIHTDFPTKFGIPRQSGIIASLQGLIVFEPEYRNIEAVRGLEDFSHIWLLWQFSEAVRDSWSPTVRPPRLGGNVRKGVFATRSPFRPNPIGLSSVRLEKVEIDPNLGPVLHVSGADLMDGTPIYDIKPYIAYTDSHPEPSVASLQRLRNTFWKWTSPRVFCIRSPKHNARVSSKCSPTTRARNTKTTLSAFMVWLSERWK